MKSIKGSGKGRQAGGCSVLLISHWLGRTGESKLCMRQPNVDSQLEVLARALPAAREGGELPAPFMWQTLFYPSASPSPFFPFPFALGSSRDRLLFFPTDGEWDWRPLPVASANHALRWWQRPIYGAAAFNELQGQRDRGKTNNSHPQSPSALHCWLPAFQDAQAGLPKACRQVYEIKARHTINNVAANHKKPFPCCIGARLYDVYIHSSAHHFHVHGSV